MEAENNLNVTENNELIVVKKIRKTRVAKINPDKPPKAEKTPRVKKILIRKTDSPTYGIDYAKDYYSKHKEQFADYCEKAKEKLFYCVECHRGGKAKNHQRHNRTPAHIRKTNVFNLNLVEL